MAATKTALLAAISAQLPTTQVSVANPGEDKALRESVWIERLDAEFEDGSLGMSRDCDREIIGIDLAIQVYREAGDQTDAADAALDRADAIFDEIGDARVANPTLSGAVGWWRATRWSVEPRPREKGWLADGRAHIEAIKHP